MNNEIITRRGLIIALVIATVVIFIGLVWLIATFQPWNWFAIQQPTTTIDPQVIRDCTYPISYWKAHPELYPGQIIIGGMIYREFELEALLLDDTQDTAQQLKAQMAVAFLNGQAGADQSSIEMTLFDAYGWLMRHPTGGPITDEELEQGRHLFDSLEAYNLGIAGVTACEPGIFSTRTPTPTEMASPETSLTPSPTFTSTASQTPTELAVTATFEFVLPTATVEQTREPPVQHPTDTQAPPIPTDTAEPPVIPTNTPGEPPTLTPPPTEVPTITPPP